MSVVLPNGYALAELTPKRLRRIIEKLRSHFGEHFPTSFEGVLGMLLGASLDPSVRLDVLRCSGTSYHHLEDFGETRPTVLTMMLAIAHLLVVIGEVSPQPGWGVMGHIASLAEGVDYRTQPIHMITSDHPIGSWLCSFTEEYLGLLRERYQDEAAEKHHTNYQQRFADQRETTWLLEENLRYIHDAVRDTYLQGISENTDSKIMLQGTPVFYISPHLRHACFPDDEYIYSPIHSQAEWVFARGSRNTTLMKPGFRAADRILAQLPYVYEPGELHKGAYFKCPHDDKHGIYRRHPSANGPRIVLTRLDDPEYAYGRTVQATETTMLHEIIHAIHPRFQWYQDYGGRRLARPDVHKDSVKLQELADAFQGAVNKLLDPKEEWVRRFGEYTTTDVEMLPHIGSAQLAVMRPEFKDILHPPARALYDMHTRGEKQAEFQHVFGILEEIKRIDSSGLHTDIPGIWDTNYDLRRLVRQAATPLDDPVVYTFDNNQN